MNWPFAPLTPLSYGAITWMTGGDQRTAILSTAVLFAIGLVLLVPVNMQRGREAAVLANSRAQTAVEPSSILRM